MAVELHQETDRGKIKTKIDARPNEVNLEINPKEIRLKKTHFGHTNTQ